MIAGATSFNLIVIMHGSAKFAVLRKRLEALKGDDPSSGTVMADCVHRHRQAIEWVSVYSIDNSIHYMDLRFQIRGRSRKDHKCPGSGTVRH